MHRQWRSFTPSRNTAFSYTPNTFRLCRGSFPSKTVPLVQPSLICDRRSAWLVHHTAHSRSCSAPAISCNVRRTVKGNVLRPPTPPALSISHRQISRSELSGPWATQTFKIIYVAVYHYAYIGAGWSISNYCTDTSLVLNLLLPIVLGQRSYPALDGAG
ncbi:hypothetical protein BDQ17DRAFT_531899 [Cyathus striatus]|nr:hypothetical protein BDQ17DRAFT_531899 [Cyathus striatus]